MNQNSNPEGRDNFDQMLIDYRDSQISSDGSTRPPKGSSGNGRSSYKGSLLEGSDIFGYKDSFIENIRNSEKGSSLTWLSLIQNLLKSGNVSAAFDLFRQGQGVLPTGDGADDQLKDLWAQMSAQSNSDRDFARNSPSAQLQRLLATGMSREAALQALQGFESSSQPFPEGTPPTQSALAEQQARTEQLNRSLGIFNAVLGSVSAATSIGQFGISLSKLAAEKAILSAGATNAQLSLQGVTAAAELSNAVTQTVDSAGKPLPESAVPPMSKGYDAFRNWLQSPDSNANPYIASFRQKYPSIGDNPYFWDSARNNYNAWHNSRNQDELDKQNRIQTDLIGYQAEYQKTNWELLSLQFDYDSATYQTRLELMSEQLEAQRKQNELTAANVGKVNAETGKINAETANLKTEGKQLVASYEDYMELRTVRNAAADADYRLKMDRLTAMRDPALISAEVKRLKNDHKFQAKVAYYGSVRQDYINGKLNPQPGSPEDKAIQECIHQAWLNDVYGLSGMPGALIQAANALSGQNYSDPDDRTIFDGLFEWVPGYKLGRNMTR